MIEWGKLKFTAEELAGIAEIRLKPDSITEDHIIMHAHWLNTAGEEVRKDVHIQILKPLSAFGATGA